VEPQQAQACCRIHALNFQLLAGPREDERRGERRFGFTP
jgi:hypothetical protein